MPHRDPRKKQLSSRKHRRKKPLDISTEGGFRSLQPAQTRSVSLLEKVRSLFSWIANRVTEEARVEESSVSGEASAKRLLSQYSFRDLMRKAKGAIAEVELAKQALLQQFGPRAQAFVDRYVTPVIEPVVSYVQMGRQGDLSETMRGAVGSVELLAMLHDELRLSRKIRESLEGKTREVILEDIAFILSYPTEAVEDARIPVARRRRILRRIEEALQPVLLDLEALLSVRPPSSELISLFQWRVGVDARRQRLHDGALQVIDEEIHRDAPLWGSLKNLPLPQISAFLEDFELFLQGEMAWPMSLLELEEMSAFMHQLVEKDASNRADARLLALFEQVRAYVDVLCESSEGEGHEEVLGRIVDHVRAIERLLGPQ